MLQFVPIAPCPFPVHLQKTKKSQSSLYSDERTEVLKKHSRNFILKKSVIKLEQAGQKAARSPGSNLNRERC